MKRFLLIFVILIVCIGLSAQYNKGVIVEPMLKTDTTSIGQKIVYPQFENSEVTIAKVTILPGASTGWHKHSIPVFAYMVKGKLSVETKEHKTRVFKKGDSFAEVMNTMHNGFNRTKKKAVLIAIYLGEKDQPLSTH